MGVHTLKLAPLKQLSTAAAKPLSGTETDIAGGSKTCILNLSLFARSQRTVSATAGSQFPNLLSLIESTESRSFNLHKHPFSSAYCQNKNTYWRLPSFSFRSFVFLRESSASFLRSKARRSAPYDVAPNAAVRAFFSVLRSVSLSILTYVTSKTGLGQ